MEGIVMNNPRRKARPIGPLVYSRRLELGLSQESLAQRAGIPQYAISRIENSTSDLLPKPYLLNGLSKALSIPLEGIFAYAGYDVDATDLEEDTDDPTLVNWLAEGEALSPEERRHYLRLIEFVRRGDNETVQDD